MFADASGDNLQSALDLWNRMMQRIWELLTTSPQTFRGGNAWNIVSGVCGGLQATGLALLVLFFAVGTLKSCASFDELKRPEKAFRLFVRFAVTKGVMTWGLEIMTAMYSIASGIITDIASSAGITSMATLQLPQGLTDDLAGVDFIDSIPVWGVSLIGSVFISVVSFVIILTVYGRFFRIFMYTAVSPIPLASFAGETTSDIGKRFLKNYAAACLEGALVMTACAVFSGLASSDAVTVSGATALDRVWLYITETGFDMLLLCGAVKVSEKTAHEIMGI